MAARKLWTREELILSLNLYLKLPYGKLHAHTPEIIHLAKITGRTPGSIAIRLNNYASVDPFHQRRGITGMIGGKKQVEPIWNEFVNNREDLLYESEKILAEIENTSIEEKYCDELKDTNHYKGEDKIRQIKTRINQNVFRQIVIANYSGRCAVTGINISDLLIASHIIPWSKNEKERLNPENGICLSPMYDRAYDKGYIGITKDFEIVLSLALNKFKNEQYHSYYFAPLIGTKINLPNKYYPRKEFLEYHMDEIFKR